MKRFMIITHNDLDGIGAAVIGKVVFNKQQVDVKFCGYHNVNEETVKALESGKYNHVFITDISVNKETKEWIDENHFGQVSLLDHHANLTHLYNCNWATVKPGVEGIRGNECGTSLFFNYLIETCKIKPNNAMINFVEKVRRYDTWDWKNFDNDLDAKKLNDYLGIVGFFDFMNEFTNKLLKNDTELFDEFANKLLKYKQKEIDYIVKTKNNYMTVKVIDNHRIGFIYCDNYHSEIANRLLELHPDLNGIILIDMTKGKISLRSTCEREFDCAVIAKRWFNGGGRQCTAGAQIPDWILGQVKNLLYNKYTVTTFIKEEEIEYVDELNDIDKCLVSKRIKRL